MSLEGISSHNSDPPDEENGEGSSEESTQKRGDYYRQLLQNDEARAFAAALLRRGMNFYAVARHLNRQYFGAGGQFDEKKFGHSLYEISRRALQNKTRSASHAEKDNQGQMRRDALADVLSQKVPQAIRTMAQEKARRFFPKKAEPERRSVTEQNKLWEANEETAALVGKLWQLGASPEEISMFLAEREDLDRSEERRVGKEC